MLNEGKQDPLHWFFTFGVDTSNAMSYMEVEGATYEEARRLCMALNGDKWAFQYAPGDLDLGRFAGGCVIKVDVTR